MRREVAIEIDSSGLLQAVGSGGYARGRNYAANRAVLRVLWDPAGSQLRGSVRGSGRNIYETSAQLRSDDGPTYEFESGECSCPMGFDCKHVVALVLSAAGHGAPRTRPSEKATVARPPARRAPRWEDSLASLLSFAGRAAGPDLRTPLAIQLSIVPATSSQPSAGRIQARVVRPGKTGGWAAGNLSWNTLGGYYRDDCRAEHVQVLKEIRGVFAARDSHTSYYSYRDEKTIDLSGYESLQLWPLLEQADRVGVQLVHTRKKLGAVRRDSPVELCLDVTGVDDSLTIRPVLRCDGSPLDAQPVAFIGRDGHGVVYVDRADLTPDPADWPLHLARTTRPVPQPLQQLALDRGELAIPADGGARFAEAFYPRLRNLATVTSSDQSFVPPRISAPTLVLTTSYGDDHELALRWDWSYEVGDSQLRVDLYPDVTDSGFRDHQAEQEVLADLDAGLASYGIWQAGPPQPLAPVAMLRGLETMRFCTEALPLLADNPDVRVEVSGEPADYREAGDSLRIGVSADASPGETDWFDLGVTVTLEGRDVPFAPLFKALNSGEPYLLLADGAYFSLDKPELQSLRRLIEEARALQDKPSEQLRISRFQADFWSELAELGIIERQAREWQRQVGGLLAPTSVGALPEPAGLDAQLRPYQSEGFGWLAFLWEHSLGGILADDMGLGKTLQALALICHARAADPGLAPFLIVAPTSVVANWAAEAERFAPGLAVTAVSDTLRRRGQTLDEVVDGADVVITSYMLFRLDFEGYGAREWAGLLLDEAQFVKNHQSKAYQCARQLTAPFKLAITGTPMENNLMELWSLLSITAPGLFPNPTRFRDYYARPIEKGEPELLAQLRRRVKPLMKRRTKDQVATDLPAKQEQILEVDLHPRHRKVYDRHLQRVRQEMLGLVDDLDRNRFAILRSLTLLRRLSLHAGLVEATHGGLPSSKIDVLLEQLDDVVASGHRALVFSQFTGFLELVRDGLDAAGVEYCYLDGKTTRRASVVRRFKSGEVPVFLISLKAGGFGLNLTEADYCFLLDPWWNPATEAQAVDRTHRIGQTRNVMVYRLIATDTIEEKVMALKQRKAELFASVMDDGNAFGSTLDADDIRELFT